MSRLWKTILTITSADHRMILITKEFLKLMKVNITMTSVRNQLQFHPDYPSLLCLSDALNSWKIETVALQLDRERFNQLEPPFITTILNNSNYEFVIVKSIGEKDISIVDDRGKIQLFPYDDFLNSWSGSTLIAEANENSGEINYAAKLKKERIIKSRLPALLFFSFLSIYNIIVLRSDFNWQLIALIVSNILGVGICSILIFIQLDPDNDISIGICSISEKADCKSVLNSAASKIAGIGMAEIGLIFFLGNLFMLLNAGVYSSFNFSLLIWLSLLSIPYTIFSVYYQWRVIKIWCVLCLGIQCLLWMNFMILHSFVGLAIDSFNYGSLIDLSLIYLLIALLWFTLKHIFEKAAKTKLWKKKYLQLKNNKEIFSAYLHSQKKMPRDLGEVRPIVLGNHSAKNTITIITNPFCSPCAKKHEQLAALLQQTNAIKVNVIFSACPTVDPRGIEFVKHILALQHAGKEVDEAINLWFNQTEKSYEKWAEQFSIVDLEICSDQINAHCKWCEEANIQYTPTIFVNGYSYPRHYEIEEIGHLIDIRSSVGF